MTVGEKRNAVCNYCENTYCGKCKLNGTWTYGEASCLSIMNATEGELDWALHLINEPHNNPYWERITRIANRQRRKGIDTYGQGVEDYITPDAIERIEYIQEELVDALMYLEWLKEKLKGE